MARPAPLPVGLERPFRVADAGEYGVSPSRLRATDLQRPFHGMRTRLPCDDLASRAAALLTVLGATQRFSHLTAAELHGMRLPERRPVGIHVTGRDVARSVRRPGVIGHKTTLHVPVARVHGLPVSEPVDAWIECAEILRVDDLVIMGDGLVQRRDPLAAVRDLERAVVTRRGRRGAARLRAALDLIRMGTDSARETMLRLAVIRAGFPEPAVNAPLVDGNGRVIAHGDLVWIAQRLVLEYDGRHHAENPRQFAIDIRRLDDIAEAGYRVIRIDRHLFEQRTELFRRIGAGLASREGANRGMRAPTGPERDPSRGRPTGVSGRR